MHKPNWRPKSSINSLNAYARYSAIAIQMGVVIAGCIIGGIKLDQWLNLKFPVFTVVFSLLGVSAAIYLLIRTVSKTDKK
ncbi:MAG: AtpZ/AtpI family protein [Lentimicrobium sp.]|jgi:F0F1-type ATP synthase assembly protein I|nr:AtpZ/AtpI family protein [Lentimicrobium sp.]MDD2527286.1 AtpZ/AtpI family protein [Lentimicrobiaceae bacterium]MDD4597139.1 AtpZ/AtpI family protein [Lentimicrobiaceae bacterium]MDY0026737.1 AtpZ/AtpI family protein [Lentimicrobium sp.]